MAAKPKSTMASSRPSLTGAATSRLPANSSSSQFHLLTSFSLLASLVFYIPPGRVTRGLRAPLFIASTHGIELLIQPALPHRVAGTRGHLFSFLANAMVSCDELKFAA